MNDFLDPSFQAHIWGYICLALAAYALMVFVQASRRRRRSTENYFLGAAALIAGLILASGIIYVFIPDVITSPYLGPILFARNVLAILFGLVYIVLIRRVAR